MVARGADVEDTTPLPESPPRKIARFNDEATVFIDPPEPLLIEAAERRCATALQSCAGANDVDTEFLASLSDLNKNEKVINMLINKPGSRQMLLENLRQLEQYFSGHVAVLASFLCKVMQLKVRKWKELKKAIESELVDARYEVADQSLVSVMGRLPLSPCASPARKKSRNRG